MTEYAIRSMKTIYDIEKFVVSDDEIDYNLTTEQIKELNILAPSSNDFIEDRLYTDLKIINKLDISTESDGKIINGDNNLLTILGGTYLKFTVNNDEELLVDTEISMEFIQNPIETNKNYGKNYIYIKDSLVINLNGLLADSFSVKIYSIKYNLNEKYLILRR